MDLIYKKDNRLVYEDGDWIIKKFIHGITEKFNLDDYKLFQKDNPEFVEITSLERHGAVDIMIMPKVDGKEWTYVRNNVKKDVVYNFCIVNYFKWVKAFLDFSLDKEKIFFHSDLTPGNVFINDNFNPIVLDPDSMEWAKRDDFIMRIQKQYMEFFDDFYRFYKNTF